MSTNAAVDLQEPLASCRECREQGIEDVDRARAIHALYHGFPWWHRLFCSSCRAFHRGPGRIGHFF